MRPLAIVFFGLLLSLIARPVFAEPVTTIRDNGDSDNRVDIVILGDGYTAAQLGKYAADVEGFVKGLFAERPFRDYQRYFNVHRIDVASSESGADHPERTPPVFRNTALNATYSCFGIQRLLCVDLDEVNPILVRSIAPAGRDVVIVIVNDPEYGGSGGVVAVASTNAQVVELVLHELGHSFGELADEYIDLQLCSDGFEPAEANVTTETNRDRIKWNVGGGPPEGWIQPTTQVPTPDDAPGLVGLYEGARYCPQGIFRPTFDSKMRSLNRPFEEVNSEQLVRRIYNWVSPIDASEPLASSITLAANGTQDFRIQTPTPTSATLKTTWKVNDEEVGAGNLFSLSAATLDPGFYTVSVEVLDPTPLVRNDPANILTETRTWSVNINSALVRPDTMIVSGPLPLSKGPGAVFVFASNISGSKFTCSLNGAAFTACRSPKTYRKLATGFYTFQVTATDLQGISDSTPASHAWTIDSTRPETTITVGPSATSNRTSASFQFASSEGNGTFQCKLDAGAYAPCTSPQTYTNLLPGRHSFLVAAIDSAGNIDRRPAVHRWTIDTAAPETTIRTKPPPITNNQTATFSFTASQRGSAFECNLDGGGFQSCSARQTFSVTPGPHTLQVRAFDPAGNKDLSPASYSWTVQ